MKSSSSKLRLAGKKGLLAASLFLWATAAAGCGSDFDPFNLVDKLRVLGVRAEPPDLSPGESTVLDALVHSPGDASVDYRWSWCPVTEGRGDGYECAVTEEELKSLAEELVPGASAMIPSFELGQGQEATFSYPLNPFILEALCQSSVNEQLVEIFGELNCNGYLPVKIRLEVSSGAETVIAIKEVRLALDADAEINSNPTLGRMSFSDGAVFQELPESAAAVLAAGERYDLRAEIPESASETFTPEPTDDNPEPAGRRENLFVTWFITGGETEFKRTSFFDGDMALGELGENSWKTPSLADRPDGEAKLYLVIQDERGGVGWTERDVALTEPGK